jgi:bacillithiol biosynthesis deacetylase BshB1
MNDITGKFWSLPMKLDVLAIAAHPDDVEITCGGTMIKLAEMGKKTGVLDLTEGEMGTLGSPAERLHEAEEAGRILGLAARENLHLPDSALEPILEYKLKIAAVIRRYKPQTIILPVQLGQRHPDHRMASLLGYDACYLAGLAKVDLDGEPHRPHKILYANFFINTNYSFLVDVSEQMERKKQAVAAYHSQFDTPSYTNQIYRPGTNIFELLETVHRRYGIQAGCRYAEPFSITEPVVLDDPTLQPVRSI